MTDQPLNTTPAANAYDAVGWDTLTDYARYRIEQIAEQRGITLHHATDEDTLRSLIRSYRSNF